MDLVLLLSSFGLGLRHGVDWDHLAAITDITGSELERRRSAFLALLYALGHGVAVLALGALAIAAGERLPEWIDPAMERVVGVTLLVLAVFLVRSLRRGDAATVSRGVLLFRALGTMRDRLRRTKRVEVEHQHPHGHDASHAHDHDTPDEAERAVLVGHKHQHVHAVDVTRYTSAGAVAIGLLHGIGAETGTQAVVLVGASRVASTAEALLVLTAFVTGIVVTTGALALGAAFGWTAVSRRSPSFVVLTVATVVVSVVVGGFFVTGNAGSLPGLAA